MNKKIIFSFSILFFLGIRFLSTNHLPLEDKNNPYKKEISRQKDQINLEYANDTLIKEVERLPAQVNLREEKPAPLKVKLQRSKEIDIPSENTEEYGLDRSMNGVPRGMVFASSLKAISKEDFSESFGTIIKEHGNMIYFKPSQEANDDSWSHVVYDTRTSQVYPLSTVIKVLAVNDNQRSDLIAKGLEEYYYHDSLQLFYTQSSNGKLLSTVSELKKMGLDVELEAVKGSVHKR